MCVTINRANRRPPVKKRVAHRWSVDNRIVLRKMAAHQNACKSARLRKAKSHPARPEMATNRKAAATTENPQRRPLDKTTSAAAMTLAKIGLSQIANPGQCLANAVKLRPAVGLIPSPEVGGKSNAKPNPLQRMSWCRSATSIPAQEVMISKEQAAKGSQLNDARTFQTSNVGSNRPSLVNRPLRLSGGPPSQN